ncbi:MAG TPA: RimK family protein [bacterium]|nr:RimK family protein [bacterium]
MQNLIVVENRRRWPLAISGVEVVSAREYLTEPRFSELRGAKVFNFCRAYGYQSVGYYVSLLAAARAHKPMPSVETIQDLRLSPLVRMVSEELDALIQRSLAPLKSGRFMLNIYFGRNMAKRYDRLSSALFSQFPVPFLRAEFAWSDKWQLERIRPIATGEIPDPHRPFVIEQAESYFGRRARSRSRQKYRYDLAILVNADEADPPSDAGALRKFTAAAHEQGMDVTQIGRDDYGRLAEFDALFIRETTQVNHHTYRFSRRAWAEDMVVIDDPESIVRCTNKVYLSELFTHHRIAAPKTLVVHRDNVDEVAQAIGFPCVLKEPDSSFSRGVAKAGDPTELRARLDALFKKSELVIAQAFVPSEFDWRIGIIDGRVLYACKYYMADGHWQIQTTDARGRKRFGRVQTLSLDDVPPRVLRLALRCTSCIGDGLYGVDIKERNGRVMVMEVNDNPSIESGVEDAVLKDELYLAIMRVFRERLDARGLSRVRR